VGSAGTVHAFEPNSDHYASLAGCGPNLRLWPFALGGALALRTLHIPEGLDGWASLTDIRELLPGRSFVVRTVVEVPLDALTELAELSVSFIKLDAERHEARVLAGAKTFLSRHRPPVVFESPTPEIERLFHELDYRLVTFSGATWLAVEPCLPNVIAVPASRSDRLEDWLPTGAEIAALVGNAKLRFP
jgi:FkbM family methyltransferase